MKKTIQIHMGGRQFHIDEDAYQKLNHYLESLKRHFSAEGDAGKEILEDIEHRIAELLEKNLSENRQSVSIEDVNQTITILGKVEDFIYEESATGQPAPAAGTYSRRDYRRLYRDEDHNYIGGVASGLAAYFDIDALWIRVAFVVLAFLHGVGILIYLILWIAVPKARTTAEKLQMRGVPVTLSSIRESVNAEYDKVKTGFSNMGDHTAIRQTRSALENILRGLGLVFVAFFKFIIGAIGVIFLITGAIILAVLIMTILAFAGILGHFPVWNGFELPSLTHLFASSGHYYLLMIAFVVLVIIPIVALIYWGIKILFNVQSRHPALRAFLLTTWILALVLFITVIILNVSHFNMEAKVEHTARIETKKWPRLYIDVRDNTADKRITQYNVFDRTFLHSDRDDALFTVPELAIGLSKDQGMYIGIEKYASNVVPHQSDEVMDRIYFQWEQQDSVVYIDNYLTTRDEDFWMFGQVRLNLQIPEGQVVVLSGSACELLDYDQQYRYCQDSMLTNKPAVMTPDGLRLVQNQKSRSIRNK
jgi:phage shock protein PspC (stress-responsive transcriptional regulator)